MDVGGMAGGCVTGISTEGCVDEGWRLSLPLIQALTRSPAPTKVIHYSRTCRLALPNPAVPNTPMDRFSQGSVKGHLPM